MIELLGARVVYVNLRESLIENLYIPTIHQTRIRSGRVIDDLDNVMEPLFQKVPDVIFLRAVESVFVVLMKGWSSFVSSSQILFKKSTAISVRTSVFLHNITESSHLSCTVTTWPCVCWTIDGFWTEVFCAICPVCPAALKSQKLQKGDWCAVHSGEYQSQRLSKSRTAHVHRVRQTRKTQTIVHDFTSVVEFKIKFFRKRLKIRRLSPQTPDL